MLEQWHEEGSILVMGYSMYRILALGVHVHTPGCITVNINLRCISNFSRQNLLKYYFIFTFKCTELKMIHFERVRLSYLKNNHTYF